MSITLKDFLLPLKTRDMQVVVKDTDLNIICKMYADTIDSLDSTVTERTVNSWDIIRNNLLTVFLDVNKEEQTISVDGISAVNSIVTIKVGETTVLDYIISPDDATDKAVTWLSIDPTIATIEDGILMAVSEGETNVTVTTVDGGYTATFTITVQAQVEPEPEIVNVTSVVLDQENISLVANGESVILNATVLPDNATNKEVSWSVLDSNIANVENGIVSGLNEGETSVTVTTIDGGFTASCVVSVTASVEPEPEPEPEPQEIPLTNITIENALVNLTLEGEDVALEVIYEPENATDKTLIWSSSDETVATVEDGIVHAVGVGTAIITARVPDTEISSTSSVVVSE